MTTKLILFFNDSCCLRFGGNYIFSVIENLNDQEKEKLFNNLNNDDYMMSFMEKYDLVVGNIALQKSMLFLEQNEIWMSMTLNEKTALFTRNFKTDAETFTPFARLRSGSESGSECQETFDREVSKAYALAMLDLAVCSCALLPNPMVGCLCYIAVITRYYATIDTLEREKEECERQNP